MKVKMMMKYTATSFVSRLVVIATLLFSLAYAQDSDGASSLIVISILVLLLLYYYYEHVDVTVLMIHELVHANFSLAGKVNGLHR